MKELKSYRSVYDIKRSPAMFGPYRRATRGDGAFVVLIVAVLLFISLLTSIAWS